MATSSSSSSSTTTNNNKNNTKNGDDFPTGDSVSFPFEPYPQQVDLMNAILESLRLLQNNPQEEDDDDDDDKKRNHSNNSNNPSGQQQQQQQQQQRQASVWMLESPTGTGKSLSLAASVIAWLEHAEEQDLCGGAGKKVQPEEENKSTAPATTTTSWLDDWESPEDRQAKKDWESIQSTARASRQRLQKHLAAIQKQFIDSHDTSSSSAVAAAAGVDVLSKQELQQRQRSKRQTVVRMAITAARQEDQKHGRQRGYNNNNNNKRQRQQQQSKENKSNAPAKNHDDDDFCLDDYQSDNENEKMNDDDDDSDNEHDHLPRQKGKDKLSAAMLLDGAALDGSASLSSSSKLPYAGPRMTLNMTAPTISTATNTTTIPTTTIGHVQAGSGVRKVVYAARTHSQLSQFTSEIQRQWPHVRVLALGGRKSLCGNVELSSKSERVVNETCLDWQKNGKTKTESSSKSKSTKSDAAPKSKKRDSKSADSSGSSSSSTSGCPLLSSRAAVDELALQLLAHPTDIEEAAALGKVSRTCAYYASRQALAAAQIVVLPYSMLLAPATRHAIGLSLQQSLVVIDEAHNLPEALRSLHSCRLTLSVINQAMAQLLAYTKRYQQRLANRNLYYLGRLGKILLSFRKHLTKPNKKLDGRMLTPGELLIALKLDNINLFKILRYLEHSRLAQKLLGFTTAAAAAAQQQQPDAANNDPIAKHEDQGSEEYQSKHVSSMSIVQTFLEKLTTSGKEGKIVTDRPLSSLQVMEEQEFGSVTTKDRGNNNKANSSTSTDAATTLDQSRRSEQQQQQPALRYVLLQPAAFFDNVLQEAHALALVGGTLRPFVHVAAELLGEDNKDILQLAALADEAIATQQQSLLSSSSTSTTTTSEPAPRPSANKQQQQQVSYSFVSPTFTAFSCDHVVSSSNVLLQCFSNGPSGQVLDFRHQSRSSPLVCDELGRTLLRICQTVPNGVVVFLPSYAYEASLVCQWRQSGLWQQLRNTKKVVHREPKSSQQVDATLSAYAKDASKKGGGGALLLSVVGGKLSEGINFANELCRCVLVVGLPYPDITNPELKEKMAAMDRAATTTTGGAGSCKTSITGQAYYHNLCMRAVNQSVGRAIRHANDYAVVVLVDARYRSDQRVWGGLPGWLKKGASKNWKKDSSSFPFEARLQEIQDFFKTR